MVQVAGDEDFMSRLDQLREADPAGRQSSIHVEEDSPKKRTVVPKVVEALPAKIAAAPVVQDPAVKQKAPELLGAR